MVKPLLVLVLILMLMPMLILVLILVQNLSFHHRSNKTNLFNFSNYPPTPLPLYSPTPLPLYRSTPLPLCPSTPLLPYTFTPLPLYPFTTLPLYPFTPLLLYPPLQQETMAAIEEEALSLARLGQEEALAIGLLPPAPPKYIQDYVDDKQRKELQRLARIKEFAGMCSS